MPEECIILYYMLVATSTGLKVVFYCNRLVLGAELLDFEVKRAEPITTYY